MTVERQVVAAANWKMNLRRGDAELYCAALLSGEVSALGCETVLFPPYPLIPLVSHALGASGIAVGGQDLHPEEEGAHTGDVSALHLLDWSCTWVLCGHSERRADHGESDSLVAAKARAAQRHGLIPLLCVGETATQRQQGATHRVLQSQLRAALPSSEAPWALAYEPIWAIGTGHTATPEIAQEAHALLRRTVHELAGDELASRLRILYGGSVKPDNCQALIAQPDIDGFLIGGASLDPNSFLDIIARCGSPTA